MLARTSSRRERRHQAAAGGTTGADADRSDRPSTPTGSRRERRPTASVPLALGAALVVIALTLVFIAQNSRRYGFEFLWLDFTLPVGVAMLLASVAGGAIVLLVGVAFMRRAERARGR